MSPGDNEAADRIFRLLTDTEEKRARYQGRGGDPAAVTVNFYYAYVNAVCSAIRDGLDPEAALADALHHACEAVETQMRERARHLLSALEREPA